jgi:hypothetical protein
MKHILTEAQQRALFWLTPGQFCGDAPREVSAALGSLVLHHRNLATSSWRKTPRGRRYLAYCLTGAGVAERERRLLAP